MFEALKEKVAISEDELITAVILEQEAEVKKQAAKLKRQAMGELFKTKDAEYAGAFIKKKDGTKKEFFMP